MRAAQHRRCHLLSGACWDACRGHRGQSATEPPPYGAEGASANVGIMCNLRWTVWLVRWLTGIQATSWAAEWHNGVARQSVADGHVGAVLAVCAMLGCRFTSGSQGCVSRLDPLHRCM